VRVLTIRGIPINVHVSWLVIYGLITWTLAVGYFPRALPDLPAAAYWANGLLAAFLLFVSVLLHELSHSFVAMAHGLSVRGITLHVFGGVSHLEDEPPSPRAEFLIAVVGPVTSFAIAAVLWAISASGLVKPAWAHAVVSYLVLVNFAVGIFNLVPGFPLDGGRILRAALWKWKGTLGQATYMASRVGLGFAFCDPDVSRPRPERYAPPRQNHVRRRGTRPRDRGGESERSMCLARPVRGQEHGEARRPLPVHLASP